jgi:dTDP-4-dehydrorhamnose reductase
MSNRVLVLGARGMLGHVVTRVFRQNGDDVMGVALEKSADDIYAIDVTSSALDRFLYINRFDVVVNCVGVLNQYAERDPALAVYLNSYLPHKLERFYRDSSTKIIQPSTDCVFAGNGAPYDESATPDGRTYYDRSKALGELVNDKDVTLRMSIVGPDVNEGGIGLFHWFMRQTGEVRGYKNAIWTGITTMQLAKGMVAAAEQNLTGLYHYVPDANISKYEMLLLFKEIFGRDDIRVVPVEEPRIDKSLKNTRTDFDHKIPGYREMFTDMKRWIETNAALYPSYDTNG